MGKLIPITLHRGQVMPNLTGIAGAGDIISEYPDSVKMKVIKKQAYGIDRRPHYVCVPVGQRIGRAVYIPTSSKVYKHK